MMNRANNSLFLHIYSVSIFSKEALSVFLEELGDMV